jgi:hypothetical protein
LHLPQDTPKGYWIIEDEAELPKSELFREL